MYESKRTPGKKFGSAYVGKRYDSAGTTEEPKDEKSAKRSLGNVLEDKKDDLKHEAGESAEFEAGEQEGKKEKEAEQHPVVKQHGAAHTVEVSHNAGKHRVKSTHPDGHVNESEHEDAQTAHMEGGRLANVSLKKSGEAEDQQLAESEGGNSSAPDGFEMPPLV